MEQMNDLIEQMVKDISGQTQGLDPVRLGLFLGWLCAHSAQVKAIPLQQEGIDGQLEPALRSWFESLPAQGLLWEYRLILDEITWWRNLDGRRLDMLQKSETGRWDG
jgi:hypothetical protein